jgi:hypothetical protein
MRLGGSDCVTLLVEEQGRRECYTRMRYYQNNMQYFFRYSEDRLSLPATSRDSLRSKRLPPHCYLGYRITQQTIHLCRFQRSFPIEFPILAPSLIDLSKHVNHAQSVTKYSKNALAEYPLSALSFPRRCHSSQCLRTARPACRRKRPAIQSCEDTLVTLRREAVRGSRIRDAGWGVGRISRGSLESTRIRPIAGIRRVLGEERHQKIWRR